jgi:hypothetical protein
MESNGFGPLPNGVRNTVQRLSTVKLKIGLRWLCILREVSNPVVREGCRAESQRFQEHRARTGATGHRRKERAPREAEENPPSGLGGGKCQPACKPGFVWRGTNAARDDHSSGTPVAGRLTQPTRAAGLEKGRDPCGSRTAPIRFCSRWGLPCRFRYRSRGGLLPHPFTLTPAEAGAVCFLWHFPWGRPRRALPGTVFPWSPDFPPPRRFRACGSGRPAG